MNLKSLPPIAITGVTGFLGSQLLRLLEKEKRVSHILAIDKRAVKSTSKKTRILKLDITQSSSSNVIKREMKKMGCKILIHLALPTRPKRQPDLTHDILSIGTMNLLFAAGEAGITKLILGSSTDVYGADPRNPNFLMEDAKLLGARHSEYLRDRIDVEEQFKQFQDEHPKSVVTILRPCTILGPTVKSFKASFLQQEIVPTIIGYDPLMQLVHESDAMRAFMLAIEKDCPGIFNIVGSGVLPLSRALHLMRKTTLPIPSLLIYPLAHFLWHANIWSAPASHLDFLKYTCVADGEKAERILRFQPVYSTQETIWSFTGRKAAEQGLPR